MLSRRDALLGLSALALGAESASAQEPFYKGKTLTVLINYAPGGPSDIEGRLLAKHIVKHIDGHPNILIQNKDGAGGLVGTNFVGELGPRDGTMVGYFTASAWKYVIEPDKYAVDFGSFEFIGYQPSGAVHYIRKDTPPGLKSPSDLLGVKQVIVGGLSADSAKDLLLRLTLDMLGVPFKYVTGFRSSVAARLAVQRGEVNLHSESTPGYLAVVATTLVKDGTVIPLYYDPYYEGDQLRIPQGMEDSGIESFPAFYRRVKGVDPSGPLWEAYRANCATDGAMLRTIAMPPGSPAAAQAALRTALERLNKDAEYAADAMKAMQFVPQYVTGPDISARMRKAMKISPEVRTFVLNYMRGKK
jgi:hypothetical protein